MGIQSKRQRLQNKRSAKKVAKQLAALRTPTITEDDLLSFQLSHFGDDSKPNNWFVDSETALHFEPEYEEIEDGLGWYDDGVKRTLTGEQIKMFRHSEIQQLLRERRLQDGQEDDRNSSHEGYEHEHGGLQSQQRMHQQQTAKSPLSDSSIENDLVGLTKVKPQPRPKKRASHSSRSTASASGQGRQSRYKRDKNVPYDQRHKRKWEDYIDENDPVEGSLTHRRMVRELDDLPTERLQVDYGD